MVTSLPRLGAPGIPGRGRLGLAGEELGLARLLALLPVGVAQLSVFVRPLLVAVVETRAALRFARRGRLPGVVVQLAEPRRAEAREHDRAHVLKVERLL